jgi:enoyl-CoA hydratase
MSQHLLLTQDGPVAILTLNRPEALNAITVAMWTALAEATAQLATDPTVRVVLVRGAGDRAFSAGADIHEFPTQRNTPEQAARYDDLIRRALRGIQALPQPVIAVIHGLAVGGGLELAAACDVRIASQQAVFGLPIGRLGVILGLEEARLLLELIGPAALKDLVYRGELITAEEARRLGLVTHVVPPADLESAVQIYVQHLLTQAPHVIAGLKRLLRLVADGASTEDPAYWALLVETYGSADYHEGVQAFIEKRAPTFRGQ